MDNFPLQYRTTCEQIVLQHNFTRKKNVFIRVINDVCQSFYMERLSRGAYKKTCRIGFSILPLCQKLNAQQIEGGIGLYYLRQFEINDKAELDGWCYELTSESISVCIDEIARYLEVHLIPLFERANCTASAFNELLDLEKLFNENRIACLRLNGSTDFLGSNTWLNLLDSAKYYMALKNKNYDYAKASRKALLQQNLASYENAKEFLSEESLVERMDSILRLKEEISFLDSKDTRFFQHLIEVNESYSSESLKRYISV